MSQLDALEPKDPDDKVDYVVNWSRYLGRVGDTILTSTWPVVPTGITKLSDTHDGMRAIIKLGGGTAGTDYQLTNRIVTTPGDRQRDRTITIRVRDR